MKLALEYSYNSKGQLKNVTVPIEDWQKIIRKIRKSEQILRIKTDLEEAFQEVEDMRSGKKKMQTLDEFLNSI